MSIELDVSVESCAAIRSALAADLHEPQLVANLLYNLSSGLKGVPGLSVGGVYVHSRPHIKCSNFPSANPPSVEIGDMLLLRSEVDMHGNRGNYRSLLLQAKKCKRIPASPDNANQLHIYANWPEFEYVRHMDHLNGASRCELGRSMSDASQYLLLHPTSCDCDPIFRRYYPHFPNACCRASTAHALKEGLSHYQDFCDVLPQFILGNAGLPFEHTPSGGSIGWSRIIEDLRAVTANQATVYIERASQKTHTKRMCFLSGNFEENTLLSNVLGFAEGRSFEDFAKHRRSVISELPETLDENQSGIPILEFSLSKKSKLSHEW